MLCTINTDASYHKYFKVGAYAFWIKSNSFTLKKVGWFNDKCNDPTECEAKCIINAIHTLLSTCSSRNVTRILVNTDSLNFMHVMKNDVKKIKKYKLGYLKKYQAQILRMLDNYKKGLDIEFRHVRAHTEKSDARSYVNEWCDEQAKLQLWIRIRQLQKKENKKKKNGLSNRKS